MCRFRLPASTLENTKVNQANQQDLINHSNCNIKYSLMLLVPVLSLHSLKLYKYMTWINTNSLVTKINVKILHLLFCKVTLGFLNDKCMWPHILCYFLKPYNIVLNATINTHTSMNPVVLYFKIIQQGMRTFFLNILTVCFF